MLTLEHGFLMQDDPAFPFSADAAALARFAAERLPRRRGSVVCDLGCGAGAVSLILAPNRPDIAITGVELREDAANLARRNVDINNAAEQITILHADIRKLRAHFAPESFTAVVSNPPYRRVMEGRLPADGGAAAARFELSAALEDFIRAAAYLVPSGGMLFSVYPCHRMAEFFAVLQTYRLEPKDLVFPGSADGQASAQPDTFLCRAVKNASPGLAVAIGAYPPRP